MSINESYRGLPQLAGVCSMQRAIESDWSVAESVRRWKRLHYVLRGLFERAIDHVAKAGSKQP